MLVICLFYACYMLVICLLYACYMLVNIPPLLIRHGIFAGNERMNNHESDSWLSVFDQQAPISRLKSPKRFLHMFMLNNPSPEKTRKLNE